MNATKDRNSNKSENKELMKRQSQLRNQTFVAFCLAILLLASESKGQNSFGHFNCEDVLWPSTQAINLMSIQTHVS
jgi:hypothetical protein